MRGGRKYGLMLLLLLATQATQPYMTGSSTAPKPAILSPGIPILISPTGKELTLAFPNGTVISFNLSSPPSFATWDEANKTLRINTTSLPLGKYSVKWTNGSYEFILDRIAIELKGVDGKYEVETFSELTGEPIKGNVTVTVTVMTPNGEINLTNETLKLPPGNYTLRILARKGNLSGELVKEVSVLEERKLWVDKGVYFPGDTVEVRVSPSGKGKPNVTLTFPDNRSVNLTGFKRSESGDAWVCRIPLNSSVLLGRYVLSMGNETTDFYVDSYSISASYSQGIVRGNVTYNFVPPNEVSYLFSSGRNGTVNVVNGSFTLPVPEGEEYVNLTCGNARIKLILERRVVVEPIYFPGETVVIRASFKPKNASLMDPSNHTIPLKFERVDGEWRSTLPLTSNVILGNYSLQVDDIELKFAVDSYTFNLSYDPAKGIIGRVSYETLAPPNLSYDVEGIKGNVNVTNGTFLIPVMLPPGNHSISLIAWGREFRINLTVEELKKHELSFGKIIKKVVAYDPSSHTIVLKVLSKGPLALKLPLAKRRVVKRIGNLSLIEFEIPSNSNMLKKFGLPEKVNGTKVIAKIVDKTHIKVKVEDKLETWYRFSVKIPKGYRVKEIVRADGKRITNSIRVNRTTGEVEGELRWYVRDGTLFFYDDPIYGYDITLTPPAPNNSLAIEEVESGQISAIVFPYSQGDDSYTIASHDHAGRTGDSYANDIDADAGSKIAIRYTTSGGTRQYGNDGDYAQTGDYILTQLSRDYVYINTVPNGVLESVIITNMRAEWSGHELNITQKTIIRDNNRWFATVYYVTNPTTETYTDLRFFQGMDWNFAGSFWGDDAYYDTANDIVYGYDTNAAPGDIQYGGFRGEEPSIAHDVNYYYFMWYDIYTNSLNNDNYYKGDAGTALAWDKASLSPGETWILPLIWGLDFTEAGMVNQIQQGLSILYDTGVLSIDTPENESRVNPNAHPTIWVNATVALYGLVDATNLPVQLSVEKVGGGYSYTETSSVNLSVPYNETAKVSYLLDVSSLPAGAYNITVKTQHPKDQNTSNDAKSIIIYITRFSVEPDQEKTVTPGVNALYNVTAYNYDEAARFDVNITLSTKAWGTELYFGSSLVAEDSDGDGNWDFIASSYDSNGNGLPDLYLPVGETNVTVVKLVPISVPLGELDVTQLNFTKVSDPSVYDEVTLTTSTVTPEAKNKQFYLHGDAAHTLNTTVQTASSDYTLIAGDSLDSWVQSPPFADRFVITGTPAVRLYLASTYYVTSDIVVDLIYTNGAAAYSIGYVSQTVSLTTTPTLVTFTIPLTSAVEVPKGYYLILRVENQGSYPLYVYHDSSHQSHVEVSTTTYIKVADASSDRTSYSPGDTVAIKANVTDPIGAYDISHVEITVYNPDGTVYLTDTMAQTGEDPSTPPLWRTYDYSFTLSDYGAYKVEIRAFETNGVSSSYNLTVYVSWELNGKVYEDFGHLGELGPSDRGIPNVRVLLYHDNGDGVLDDSDKLIDYDITGADGSYTLHATVSDRVFVAVDSGTITSTRGLNPGHTGNEIWAEQTFQSSWDGSSWVIIPMFGGRNPEKDDYGGEEHYIEVDPSYYNGESLDFGFSFDVVVNTLDRNASSIKPVGEVIKVDKVESTWKRVFTHNFYDDPVVVCTYNLPDSSYPPAVVRITNVDHHYFDVKIQNPGEVSTPKTGDVYCIVMESGSWELDDGRHVEAGKVISHGTNYAGNWGSSLMEHVSYSWSYTNPVVLGQVMSYNDTRWSVFWDSNGNNGDPPDSSNLYVGKHVGEDPDTNRNDEVIGYIVIEAGNGTTGGVRYSAQLGPNTIRGVGNSPPYAYTLDGTYSVGVATQSAMNGGNGGWAVLYGDNPISNELHLAIDEDQINDAERRHIAEQVAYWVFESETLIWAKVSDTRYAQGSLRQFIMNANAISGPDRSYFVMMVNPNSGDSSGKWWTIHVNSSLGALPTVEDDGTGINGTVFNPDMTVRDSNPGYVLNNESYTTDTNMSVGLGRDGIPNTGDEHNLSAFEKPEVEIDLNKQGDYGGIHVDWGVSNFSLARVAVYDANGSLLGPEAAVFINGGGIKNKVEDCFIGVRANGSDPGPDERNPRYGLRVDRNNATVKHNYVGYNGYGILLYSYTSKDYNATVEENEVFANGRTGESPDGDGIGVWMNGNVIRYNYAHDNGPSVNGEGSDRGSGIEIWNGTDNWVVNNTVVNNSYHEVRIAANSTNNVIMYNLIADDEWGPGILLGVENGIPFNNSVRINSIFNNSRLGIDITSTAWANGDGVTQNDGAFNSSQPNNGTDYPIIVGFYNDANSLFVAGYINEEDAYKGNSTFSGATVDIYLVNNTHGGDNGTGNDYSGTGRSYGEGWIYLGSLTADSNGEFYGTLDISSLPDWAKPDRHSNLTAVTYIKGKGTSEFGPAVPWRPLSVSVNKTIKKEGDCTVNVTLEVKNNNPWPSFAKVYDVIPDGMSMASSDPSPNGNSGNVYWWYVILGPSGTPLSTKNITYTMQTTSCGATDYNLSDALIVGIDPPSPAKPRVEVREYLYAIFHYDGSYVINDHFGFLTAYNPTSDVIQDLKIYLNAPGYTFYPDYPAPSSTPVSPPLRADRLDPGDYVRWRFDAPLNVTPPVTVRETLSPSTAPYGRRMVMLEVKITAEEPLDNATYVKPLDWIDLSEAIPSRGRVDTSGRELVWVIGPMREGETADLVIRGWVSCTSPRIELPNAEVSISCSSPPLLHNISIDFSGQASVGIEKNRNGDHYDLKASFSNRAKELIYNLTRVCVYEGEPSPTARLVFCEEPNAILGPGASWISPTHPDMPDEEPPRYFVVANFTGEVEEGGSYDLVHPLPGGDYESSAPVREPFLKCVGSTISPVTTTARINTSTKTATATTPPTGGAIPIPTTGTRTTTGAVSFTATTAKPPIKMVKLSLAKACEPRQVEVGGLVKCTITVSNEGNATAKNLLVYDLPPSGLEIGDAGSGRLLGNRALWNIPKLDPEGRIELSVILRALREGNYTNIARVGNLTASAPVEVIRARPGIKLQKVGIYLGKGMLTYLVRMSGPPGVEVVDDLPDGVELIRVESKQRISWKQELGGRRIRIRAENGSALVNLTVHYPSWPLGGELTNRAYIPKVTRVEATISIKPLSKGSMVGMPVTLLPLLLALLFLRRRRRAVLLDYWTFRDMLLSGITPKGGHAITEATLYRALEDPVLAPMVEELLKHRDLQVVGIDEESAVQALEIARRNGLHIRDAAEALVTLGEGKISQRVEVFL